MAVPGADRALAVYNAARSYLPLLAALAANGAFYEGRDSELASVRPFDQLAKPNWSEAAIPSAPSFSPVPESAPPEPRG